jgi:serine/threonine-protein kinase
MVGEARGGTLGGGTLGRQGDVLVGKYVLERVLGQGAMGEVWRAQNAIVGRPVAIKLLRSEHTADTAIVTRFLREARAANLVRHANVVDVLDVGQDAAGRPFLVQELLEGRDLGAHLSRVGHGLPMDAAMEILLPIVEAVAFAHGRGVVHRDIKPENVFLAETPEGTVPKLLDFGISQVDSEGAARMTATGVALGTPAYMSPEQIKGTRHVDVRTDVWALGVLIHEVLSGELPFKAETVADHFVQIATANPTPLAVAAPHAPSALGRIVAKCLRRSPNERYADAATLLQDLRAVAADRRPRLRGESGPGSTRAIETASPAPRPPEQQPVPRDVPLVELEAAPANAAPLELESALPVRKQRRFQSIHPTTGDATQRRMIASLAVAIAALGGAGVLTLVNPWPEEWALAPWSMTFLAGASPPIPHLVALLLVGLGVGAGVVGWRRDPRAWGHLVAAAGAVATATVIVAAATGQLSWAAMPWVTALGAVGVAAIAVRAATDSWLNDIRGTAVMLASAATAALYVARELLR